MSTVLGTSSISPLAPVAAWTAAGLNKPNPYCSDSSTNYAPANNSTYSGTYTLWPPATTSTRFGTFAYRDSVAMSRQPCQVLDSTWAIPNPLEVNTLFLPTRIVSYVEDAPTCDPAGKHISAITGAEVINTTETECTYAIQAPGKLTYWIPDVEVRLPPSATSAPPQLPPSRSHPRTPHPPHCACCRATR
jgi:hypothetical protein